MNVIEQQNLLMEKWEQEHTTKGYVNFISDGILNYELWKNSDLKICLFLKEAYGDYKSLQNLFKRWGEAKYQLWHNASYWIYGINHVYKDNFIPDYDKCKSDNKKHYELLQSSSVVNIKKSNGVEYSDEKDLKIYLDNDREFLLKELELINPNIIICGGTYKQYCRLNGVEPYTGMKKITDWTYNFNGKIIIDYIHPSAPRIHGAMSYYTISAMFQKVKDSIEISES